MRGRDEVVERIASDIQQWLAGNPDAKDTVEGIRDYWLTEANRHQPKQLIEDALELLRTRKVVRVESYEGIPRLYGSEKRGYERKDG